MIPRITTPPAAELDAIHEATLRLLADVGVTFPEAGAQALLAAAGAAVDAETGRVRIPSRLVDDALAAAPRDVLLAGRDPALDVRCDGSDVHLTLDGTGAYTLDHRTGERRPSTMQDLADATLVADAAEEVGVVWNIVSAADAPPNTQVLNELVAILTHTGKHIQGEVQRAEEVPFVMEILAAATEGGRWDPVRPFFSIVYCPVPPLQHEPEMLGAGLALAREGVPMCVYSMGLAGATAPVTLAGAVMQANAEILSSIVLFQLARPGLGCVYVADTGVMDMRAGAYAAAAPESVLITQAMVGLARRYDLPVMATGLTGDANEFSFMSGSDAGMTALTSALMDPDLLCGAGMQGGAQMLSLPKILLDCELFRQCRRIRAGLTVDAEHLMEEVVAAVGPGGHFLRARETRQFLRRGELYTPRLMPREPFESWSAARTAETRRATEEQRAVAAVEEILATHRPLPLPAGADERIAAAVAAAGRELGGR
ncbi:MAG TPA: trimethylamine methyltransferase family protein [Thermoleophilia bacterium]